MPIGAPERDLLLDQQIAGGEASLALGVIPLNTGPSVSAPLATESDDVLICFIMGIYILKLINFLI